MHLHDGRMSPVLRETGGTAGPGLLAGGNCCVIVCCGEKPEATQRPLKGSVVPTVEFCEAVNKVQTGLAGLRRVGVSRRKQQLLEEETASGRVSGGRGSGAPSKGKNLGIYVVSFSLVCFYYERLPSL